MTARIDGALAHRLKLLQRREAGIWRTRSQLLADVREAITAAEMRGNTETVIALGDIEGTLAHALEYGIALCPVLSQVVVDDAEPREPWQ